MSSEKISLPNSVDFKLLWPQVWDRICRHMDGFAIGSTVAALEQRGVLSFLLSEAPVSMGLVRRRFNGNPGYLHAAFRLLACQGWLTRVGELGSADLAFKPTSRGAAILKLAPAYAAAVAFLPAARDLETTLFGDVKPNARAELSTFADHIRNEWGLRDYDAAAEVRQQVRHHLDGQVITPLMSILSLHGVLPSSLTDAPVIDLQSLNGNLENLKTAFEILACMGWANILGEQVEITQPGMLALNCARQYWYPMGYLETFIRVPELLFGDPRVTLVRTEAGEESHVDRKLDIQFSGNVFSKTCRQPFLEIALPLFDHPSFALQPAAIVDTGCGDGTLLQVLYENIRDRTRRGPKLRDYPLTVIGVEPNKVARDVAAAKLTESGIPHHVVDGNIADPTGLAQTLSAIGFDPYNALHLCKSVIHNRPYQKPENPVAAGRRRTSSTGAFVAPDGAAIPNSMLEQNLVEHFRSWRELAYRHGLLVIEAHTVDPAVTAKLIGRSIGTVVDATHAYSNQNLVEPEVFMSAAREAGFSSRAHRELGKESVGHTVLTIDHFVTEIQNRER